MEDVGFSLHAEFIEFGANLGTAQSSLRAVPRRSDCSWKSSDFLGPCVRHRGRGRWRRRRESVQVLGHCLHN